MQGAFLPVPPVLGGAVEKMWYALGKEFVRQGHEVIHISRLHEQMQNEEYIEGVLHKRVRGYSTPSSGLYLKWLDLLYTLRVLTVINESTDIIVTNTFWMPILVSSKLKKRCVVDVARFPKGQMKLYKKVGCLRANSTSVATAIKKELSVQYYKNIEMIPNPLPFQKVHDINLNNKKNVLLYAGRIHPEKGLEILIGAFKILQGNWVLRIVGPSDIKAGGGGTDYLESLKKLAHTKHISFSGPVYDIEKLNNIYAEASVFVYPSIAEQGETFGLAPLEAMAWGCVPIVSDLACFHDFISHKKNGLIFNHRNSNAVELLKNEIEILETNVLLRNELANEAVKVCQTHSAPLIATQFIKMFERVKTINTN